MTNTLKRLQHGIATRGDTWTQTICGQTLQGFGLGRVVTDLNFSKITCKRCRRMLGVK